MTKNEAISRAFQDAHASMADSGQDYAFAVEGVDDNSWYVSANKPSLRLGKVIECRASDGKTYHA